MKTGGFLKRNTPLNRGASQIKRSSLDRGTSQMRRTRIRPLGPIGKKNLAANKIIRETMANIVSCEVAEILQIEGCFGGLEVYLTNAHRHKRSWYKGDVELLSDRRQVIKACTRCHEFIEHNADLTEEVFMQLRGQEE